jgi:hypothetical protein
MLVIFCLPDYLSIHFHIECIIFYLQNMENKTISLKSCKFYVCVCTRSYTVVISQSRRKAGCIGD